MEVVEYFDLSGANGKRADKVFLKKWSPTCGREYNPFRRGLAQLVRASI